MQQLSSVKKQLDDELEHLTTSFTKLRAAQTKFQDCRKSIENGLESRNDGQPPVNIDNRSSDIARQNNSGSSNNVTLRSR